MKALYRLIFIVCLISMGFALTTSTLANCTVNVSQESSQSSNEYGLLSFLADPLEGGLRSLTALTGKLSLGIVLMTLLLRLVTLPLLRRSLKRQRKMNLLKAQIDRIRNQFKDNPLQVHTELKALYLANGVNPLWSILPNLLQIPLFLAFYNVITHLSRLWPPETFLWITNLAQPDPFLLLPVLAGMIVWIQMWHSKRNQVSAGDTKQFVLLQRVVPLVAGAFAAFVPAAVTLYIVASGGLQLMGQFVIEKWL